MGAHKKMFVLFEMMAWQNRNVSLFNKWRKIYEWSLPGHFLTLWLVGAIALQ